MAEAGSIQSLQQQAASLLLYQSVLEGEAGQAFLALLQAIRQSDPEGIHCLQAYGRWFKALAETGESWQDYLITRLLRAENPFTQQAQQGNLPLSLPLMAAVRHDLRVLQQLAQCSSDQLSQWVQCAVKLPIKPVIWDEALPLNPSLAGNWAAQEQARAKLQKLEDWGEGLENLVDYYQRGSGLFAEYHAFRWRSGQLKGIPHPDPVRLTELAGCDAQRQVLVKNTEFLLAGYPALHVLLYGCRGSGKSSMVKALVHEYGDRGLRLVEVAKSDLPDLPEIAEQLRSLPQKFIIFVDDLSFEEDEVAYKSLKVLLEGSLMARPQNVVVYATSNRRHLIREFFGDRPRPSASEEVHAWDTVQEKLSLSDRFGLTLTFEPADQQTYLTMVQHLANAAGIPLSREELEYRALQWATRHNGRSGRTARQFVSFLQADLGILSGDD